MPRLRPERRLRWLVLLALPLLLALWLDGRPLEARSEAEPAPLLGPARASADAGVPPLPDGGLDGGVGEATDSIERDAGAPISPMISTVEARTPPLTGTTNILLVGVDRRPGRRRGGRPDTLLLIVLDGDSRHVGVVSIPRDLYVSVPGHGPARINASFGIARREGVSELGLLRRVAEDTLALPIEHAVAVDLAGFEAIVDAVGGVTVDVPCPIRDRFHDPRSKGGRRDLDVAEGRRHLDGATAAMYVRSRHGRSDWSRSRRQQALLFGLKRELLTTDSLMRLPSLWDAFSEMVETDMRRVDLLRLARRLARVEPQHVHGILLGHREVVSHRTAEGRAVLLPDYAAIDEALGALFEAPAPGLRPRRAPTCPDADVALQPRETD